MSSANTRASRSTPPPGAKGTIIRIKRVGYCPSAATALPKVCSSTPAPAARISDLRFMFFIMVSPPSCGQWLIHLDGSYLLIRLYVGILGTQLIGSVFIYFKMVVDHDAISSLGV